MCFVRTESLHFDPVVPSNYPEGININTYSDSDASIVITDELNEDNEQNTGKISLHFEPMDYSVDGNEWKLLSFESSWEKLCLGFYDSFLIHCKKGFFQSIIFVCSTKMTWRKAFSA